MLVFYEQVHGYLGSGGVVMGPLLAVGFVLWFLLTLRFVLLRRGFSQALNPVISSVLAGGSAPTGQGVVAETLRMIAASVAGEREKAGEWEMTACVPGQPEMTASLHSLVDPSDSRVDLELVFKQEKAVLNRFRRPVRVLAAIAPLLGLLGTVIGMIETFAALTDRQLFAQTGGVAGGISMALLTTQLGLLVAIPGLFVGRLLDRREARLREELERLDYLLRLHLAEREVTS